MKITKNTFLQVSYHYNTILTRNPLNYYSLKVTKFHNDSVKNESARTKTACLGLTACILSKKLGLLTRA